MSDPYRILTDEEIEQLKVDGQKALDRAGVGGKILWKFWQTVSQFFSAMFGHVWDGAGLIGERLIKFLTELIPKDLFSISKKEWDEFVDNLQKSYRLDANDVGNLKNLYNITAGGRGIIAPVISASLLMSLIGNFRDAVGGTMYQKMMKDYSPNPPPAGSVLNAAFVAPEKTKEVRDAMARNGLSPEDIDLLFLAAYRMYGEGTIRDLYLRGALNESQLFIRMRELGYTDTRTREIIKSWVLIPPIQDIIRYIAKEAFEPDMIARYGLGDEYPKEAEKWAKMHGLEPQWVQKEWFAHWEHPGLQVVLEMYHRNVITWDAVYDYFRVVEIPPYWRDKIRQVSHNPYTRVDVRRMHDYGVLNDEQLMQSYKDLGYDDEKAGKMVEWTIKYNLGGDRQLTRTQIEEGYREKILRKETALNLLEDLGYSQEQSKYILTMAEYQEAKKLQGDKIKIIGNMFLNNLIDNLEARNRLNELRLHADKVDVLIDGWFAEKRSKVKYPSKADLDKFFKAKIITEVIWKDEMRKLDYTDKYINWYFELAKKG